MRWILIIAVVLAPIMIVLELAFGPILGMGPLILLLIGTGIVGIVYVIKRRNQP